MKEVGDLLKKSITSKINAKTTWASTLIDEFENVDAFKEKATNTINFQHASIVLDGCMKVYSTRVDSVVDEAEKLIECVGRAAPAEKTAKEKEHKEHITLAPQEAISLKKKTVSLDDEMLEHLARESKEGDTRGVLMHLIKWSDTHGLRIFQGAERTDPLPVPSEVHDKECTAAETEALQRLACTLWAEEKRKHISPMFAKFTPDASLEDLAFPTYAYYISYEDTPQPIAAARADEEYEEGCGGVYEYGEDLGDPEDPLEASDHLAAPSSKDKHASYGYGHPQVSITPFGYIQGWVGPSHWKMHSRLRKRTKEKTKEKKKAVVDFLNAPDICIETLFEKDPAAILTPQQISERRKNPHMLPTDYNVRVEDLYRMFICPGMFYSEICTALPERAPSSDTLLHNMHLTDTSPVPEGADDLLDDVYLDPPHLNEDPSVSPLAPSFLPASDTQAHAQPLYVHKEASLLSRRLLQSTLRRGRRNDIVQVKKDMWSKIEQGEKQVHEIYTGMQEEKVSPHFCFVSLLHLANEKNLHITSQSASLLSSLSELTIEQ